MELGSNRDGEHHAIVIGVTFAVVFEISTAFGAAAALPIPPNTAIARSVLLNLATSSP